MDVNTDPVVVEETYVAPIDVVWKAITDKDQMRQWFFETMTDFEPESGFETQFNVRCEDQDYPHIWRVTEVVPQTRIAYDWRYGGYPGSSSVVWELSKTVNGTRLTLSHKGHETFPQDVSAFSRESCQAGWEFFLRDRLTAFLQQQGK